MRIQNVLALSTALLIIAVCNSAQDSGFVGDWEVAQRDRPRELTSIARIADSEEPGTPLLIHGRVYLPDGVTPAAGVVVFAWQTDHQGVYNEPGKGGWRIRGWAKTDAEGRFEFRTIRPGSYPGGSTPAHVHFTIDGADLPRRWTSALHFADDPLVGASERKESEAAGRFGSVRPVRVGPGGVEVVEINLGTSEGGLF
ncbi:MAG: protocatechuate 3,4-dioxygenase [Acidobacteria bacterium]|nr:protocatechuate 3,4-dioxygenase [Acidobacteriota bacterium]